MSSIILATLNARYSHTSLGLRYLLANMGELQPQTELIEFVISANPAEIVETLLDRQPRVIGLSVYIWNVEETTRVVALLKQVAPEVAVVLGGPEVSYEYDRQTIVQLADYLIPGPADLAFGQLCQRILDGDRPAQKVIRPEPVALDRIRFPYRLYSDEDIAHRLIYVEASRGCPFKCEFCLSSLDKSVQAFDPDLFLTEMRVLHERGARKFKFVDRTFNLNIKSSLRILEFFLERLDDQLFLHFEVVPDHLPAKLRETIARFPPGSLQFEIGIQTFNPAVQALISRKQDDEKTGENVRWLREQSHAHIHADLIIGLPGEEVASFASGFNRLVELGPHEIQVGILKRLRGTPIHRHTDDFGIRYSHEAPYTILCSDLIDFKTMQRLTRFARYWEMVANTGRFSHTLPLLLGSDPYARFQRFADWLYATIQQTHRIALERLFDLIQQWLTEEAEMDAGATLTALVLDYKASGARGRPKCMAATPNWQA
jgi:radical SAM superfamily enzyme YgiQ (UPF0313 family)